MVDWLATHPVYYWILAWLSFALAGGAALVPLLASLRSQEHERRWLRRLPPRLFLVLCLLCLGGFRWPIWYSPAEYNPDESELLGEAITLQHRPVFWADVDGTTHGPLDVYPLLLFRDAGLGNDYTGERILSTLLAFALFAACYRTFAVHGRESLARVAALPILGQLAFSSHGDFLVYSSESVPVALLAGGLWSIVSDLSVPEARRASSGRWLLAGLLLGSVPLAKLQGGPVAAALLAVAAVCELGTSGIAVGARWRRVLALAGASFAPAAGCTLLVAAGGFWRDFWIPYVLQNLNYASVGRYGLMAMIRQFPVFAGGRAELFPYLGGASVVIALGAAFAPKMATVARGIFALILVYLISGFLVALMPGRFFAHYLWFIVAPVGMLAGVLWIAAWKCAEPPRRPAWAQPALLGMLLVAFVVPQVAVRAMQPQSYLNGIRHFDPSRDNSVAREILRYGRPGEPLGMWGWMCRYYVYTGMWQATREGDTSYEIDRTPLQPYFRRRYLQDLERNRPPVFLDAVGPGNAFYHRRALAHESFPALRDYIAAHYRQTAEIDGCRIYVRLDRLAPP